MTIKIHFLVDGIYSNQLLSVGEGLGGGGTTRFVSTSILGFSFTCFLVLHYGIFCGYPTNGMEWHSASHLSQNPTNSLQGTNFDGCGAVSQIL